MYSHPLITLKVACQTAFPSIGRGLLAALIAFLSNRTFALESNIDTNHIVIPSAVSSSLKKSTVLRTLKARSGALWFYTFEGLVRYDGRSVQSMGFPNQLQNVGIFSDVLSLLESRDGMVSIATKDGVYPLEENEIYAKQRRWTETLAREYGGLSIVKDLGFGRLLMGFHNGKLVVANLNKRKLYR